MADRDDDFVNDVEVAVQQQIEGGMHESCETVFDRREDIVGTLIGNRLIERFEGWPRDESNVRTQQFHGSVFAKRAGRTLISHSRSRRRRRAIFTLWGNSLG